MFSFLQQCPPPPLALSSRRLSSFRVLLPSLPTSELHYYQQSAFKSAPAQHQDVFCMLILGDTDPSLLRRSLMPGVPGTAGKTVSARGSAHTMEDLRPPQRCSAAEHFTVVRRALHKNNTGFSVKSRGCRLVVSRGKCCCLEHSDCLEVRKGISITCVAQVK